MEVVTLSYPEKHGISAARWLYSNRQAMNCFGILSIHKDEGPEHVLGSGLYCNGGRLKKR